MGILIYSTLDPLWGQDDTSDITDAEPPGTVDSLQVNTSEKGIDIVNPIKHGKNWITREIWFNRKLHRYVATFHMGMQGNVNF